MPKLMRIKSAANAIVGGQIYNQTMQEIAYPHIQTHRRYTPAEISAKVIDLKVAPVKVGYIMGTGDKVPEAIKRLGLDVTMLEEKDLATGDLSKYRYDCRRHSRFAGQTGFCRQQQSDCLILSKMAEH